MQSSGESSQGTLLTGLLHPPASPVDPIPLSITSPSRQSHGLGSSREQEGHSFPSLLLKKGILLPHPSARAGAQLWTESGCSHTPARQSGCGKTGAGFHSVSPRRRLERASFSRQHCMLVYKPSPARLASVSVQFSHGAPFCRSTVVKTVSSSGTHASSSLAHVQTRSGFCS